MRTNLDALNKWLLPVSNVGVIAGQTAEVAMMGDTLAAAYATAVTQPSEMTREQVGRVWAFMNSGLIAAQNTWLAREAGYASDADPPSAD